MAEFDIAIAGTSLLAGLLAGVLARDHGKTVVRVGRPLSPQRLPRSLDLALPLATRPETWRVLRRAEAETRTLLGSMGIPQGFGSAGMEIVSDLPAGAAALDHMAHMALGYGHQVRRIDGGWAFRQVARLDRETIEGRLGEWLKAAGVTSTEDAAVGAGLLVLADNDAILDRVPERNRPAPLVLQAMTSTLLVSARALPAPIRRFADRGVTLVARPGNTVLAVVAGGREVEARLASTLAGPFPVKRLATTHYHRFTTADGAPVIGKAGKQFLLAGLGDAAPFFAPALARLLAGTASADEKRWFAAHDPARPRTTLAEYVPHAEGAA